MKVKDLLKIESNYTKEEKKIILSFLLGCKINDLFLIDEVTPRIVKKYRKMIKEEIPVQYLIKQAYFLNNVFYVNKNVLIPRFETEELVVETNNLVNNYLNKKIKIIDVGTGSGCIAISTKKINPKNEVAAIDISSKALRIAKKNAKRNNVDVNFIKSNMLDNVTEKYDVLISNPPYLDKFATHIDEKVLKYEPHLALFGGLKYYEIILKDAKRILKEKNIIAFEIGYNQKKEINNLINKYYPHAKIINKKDLNKFDRYIYILNNIE